MVIYSYKAFANIIDHLIFSTTLEGRQDWYYSHFRDDRNKFRQTGSPTFSGALDAIY